MKTLAPALVLALALFVLLGAGSSGPSSGLRGIVLISPSSPTCGPGSCTRPAPHALLRFWRKGQMVAHTRSDASGRYRITLQPRTYIVTSGKGAVLKPLRVTVATDRYRSVTFKIDTGIR